MEAWLESYFCTNWHTKITSINCFVYTCRIFCVKKSGWRLRTSFRRVSYLFLDPVSIQTLILINYLMESGCGYSLTRPPCKNQIKVVAVFSGKITAYISFAGSCDCKCAGMSPPLFSDMSYCLALCMVKPNHFTYILSHISPLYSTYIVGEGPGGTLDAHTLGWRYSCWRLCVWVCVEHNRCLKALSKRLA